MLCWKLFWYFNFRKKVLPIRTNADRVSLWWHLSCGILIVLLHYDCFNYNQINIEGKYRNSFILYLQAAGIKETYYGYDEESSVDSELSSFSSRQSSSRLSLDTTLEDDDVYDEVSTLVYIDLKCIYINMGN